MENGGFHALHVVELYCNVPYQALAILGTQSGCARVSHIHFVAMEMCIIIHIGLHVSGAHIGLLLNLSLQVDNDL